MEPGERVGRYVVEALLGRGGMGEVYRAYDEVLHRRVALKLIRTDLDAAAEARDTDGSVERVLREARMAAAFEHANVVAIHDVGEHEGIPFIVMELVTGSQLRAFIGGDASVAERTRWLADIARALSAAHRVGLVHRDVKPENVIVRDDGAIKVLDFGIARRAAGYGLPVEGASLAAAEGTAVAAQPSTIAGTPAYMAPEQISGDPLDGRSDQFAWGVVAYELLTGALPWTGTNYLSAALFQAAPPIDAAKVGVSDTITAVVARALEKRPGARFDSMDALLLAFAPAAGASSSRDVTRVLGPSPDSSAEFTSAPTLLATKSDVAFGGPAKSEANVRPPARSWRWGAAALGATVIAIGGGRIAAMRGASSPVTPAVVASAAASALPVLAFRPNEPKRLTFDPGCEEFPALTPDGKTLLFDTTVGEDSHVLALDLATGSRRTLTQGKGWQYAAAVSPDGTRYAYLDQYQGEVATYVAPLDASAPPRLVGSGIVRPSWSLDGTAIWCGTKARVDRVDLVSGRPTRSIDATATEFLLHALELPDGRVAANVVDRDHEREAGIVMFARDGSATKLVDWEADETLSLAPDGAHLFATKLLANGRGELWQIPLDGSPGSLVPGGPSQVSKGFALGGGRMVWSTCRTSRMLGGLAPATAGDKLDLVPLFPQPDWDDNSPVGIPTSETKLVAVSNRSGARQLWVLDLSDAEPPRALDSGPLVPSDPAVSADGRWVAFTVDGHGLYVMPIDGSSPPRAVTDRGSDREPAFSRDGKLLYFDAERERGGRAIESIALEGATAPTVVIDRAMHPAASAFDDRLVYVAESAGTLGTPRMFDLRTRASSVISPAFGPERHTYSAFSRDGKTLAITKGYEALVVVDAKHGKEERRFHTNDQITGVTFVGSRIVISRDVWGGDLWTADAKLATP